MKNATSNGMKTASAITMAACALGAVLVTGVAARADLRATMTQGGVTRIDTRLEGSVLEAIVDGLQLAANVISIVRSIASGDAAGVLNGAIGAYNEALQLSSSAGDHAASGSASIVIDPNTTSSTRFTFRVTSNDDPIGAVRVGAPVRDGIRVTTPPREDWSDRGIGYNVAATVDLDLTRVGPGRIPLVFTTKETNCSQCLSIVHVVIVEVTRRCPQQGSCAQQRTTYNRAQLTYAAARGTARTLAGAASRTYVRSLVQLRACLKNHRDPSACSYIELAGEGSCPELALGATQAQCSGLRGAAAQVESARLRMETEWRRGVDLQCCLFGCTGGRADQPWWTVNAAARSTSARSRD